MIGQRLAHFCIIEQIGAGGMGVVYRAHDEQLDRDVAIKVLPATSFHDPAARARLLREARTASKLNHPHVCTIHEVGESEDQVYIAMELVEGRPLSKLLEGGALPVADVLRFGIQLADAMAHAHERGIIHRDLKSANVIVTPEGRAKVLDFGLAKRMRGRDVADATTRTLSTVTEAGTITGTLAYMAPEQLRGQAADARSDIWALGVVLYEMAAGARPFRGDSGFELSSSILTQPPPPLPAGVPAELGAVIERCLAKDPGHRYQRATDAGAALDEIGSKLIPWAGWRYTLTRRRWPAAVAAAAILALVLALDVGGLRTRLVGGAAGPRFRSLAVLPLANLSGDPQQDYFAEGMHDALITDLAKLSGLQRVIARRSVLRYQKTDKPPRQIAKELGADAIITGSVLREGGRVRITAQLIDASNEEQVWAESYERELRGVLSLQAEIVAAVAREVKLRVTPQEKARLAGARPVNPEAHEAFLRGRFHIGRQTPEEIKKGLAYLQQAVEKDPTHPLPYARLAIAYNQIGHGPAPPPDTFARAREAALKALELDPNLAEAHEALGEIKLFTEWGDWEGAGQAFRRALELNPNMAEAHRIYSWYLFLTSNPGALPEMRRAIELDPLTPLWTSDLGWQYYSLGQLDKAIEEIKRSLELDPDFGQSLANLGDLYADKGMHNEAIAVHQRAVAVRPVWGWALGRTYALAGRAVEARKLAAEYGKKVGPLSCWGLAGVYAALGDKDEAFRWLEIGYQTRTSFLPWMRQNPTYAPLRSDPRFEDLVRRMKLPPMTP